MLRAICFANMFLAGLVSATGKTCERSVPSDSVCKPAMWPANIGGKTFVLIGVSGSGKSSTTNILLPTESGTAPLAGACPMCVNGATERSTCYKHSFMQGLFGADEVKVIDTPGIHDIPAGGNIQDGCDRPNLRHAVDFLHDVGHVDLFLFVARIGRVPDADMFAQLQEAYGKVWDRLVMVYTHNKWSDSNDTATNEIMSAAEQGKILHPLPLAFDCMLRRGPAPLSSLVSAYHEDFINKQWHYMKGIHGVSEDLCNQTNPQNNCFPRAEDVPWVSFENNDNNDWNPLEAKWHTMAASCQEKGASTDVLEGWKLWNLSRGLPNTILGQATYQTFVDRYPGPYNTTHLVNRFEACESTVGSPDTFWHDEAQFDAKVMSVKDCLQQGIDASSSRINQFQSLFSTNESGTIVMNHTRANMMAFGLVYHHLQEYVNVDYGFSDLQVENVWNFPNYSSYLRCGPAMVLQDNLVCHIALSNFYSEHPTTTPNIQNLRDILLQRGHAATCACDSPDDHNNIGFSCASHLGMENYSCNLAGPHRTCSYGWGYHFRFDNYTEVCLPQKTCGDNNVCRGHMISRINSQDKLCDSAFSCRQDECCDPIHRCPAGFCDAAGSGPWQRSDGLGKGPNWDSDDKGYRSYYENNWKPGAAPYCKNQSASSCTVHDCCTCQNVISCDCWWWGDWCLDYIDCLGTSCQDLTSTNRRIYNNPADLASLAAEPITSSDIAGTAMSTCHCNTADDASDPSYSCHDGTYVCPTFETCALGPTQLFAKAEAHSVACRPRCIQCGEGHGSLKVAVGIFGCLVLLVLLMRANGLCLRKSETLPMSEPAPAGPQPLTTGSGLREPLIEEGQQAVHAGPQQSLTMDGRLVTPMLAGSQTWNDQQSVPAELPQASTTDSGSETSMPTSGLQPMPAATTSNQPPLLTKGHRPAPHKTDSLQESPNSL